MGKKKFMIIGTFCIALIFVAASVLEAGKTNGQTGGNGKFTLEGEKEHPASIAVLSEGAPIVSAKSAVVIDIASGRVLYEKNKDEKAYPASITKIMTALVGIERGDLSEEIKVSTSSAGVEGSSIYLKAGEKISMEDLLYGAMLRSGNDAATVIAETIEGGMKTPFVEEMNRRAAEMGAKNTHFTNPTGLYDENHYTTAYDMALISAVAMHNPTFQKIVASQSWTADREEGRDPYFYNKNKVVHQYKGGTGIKIGYTSETGRTLVASSERNGFQLICVVMQAPNWFQDAYGLMDYVYDNCESAEVAQEGQPLVKVPVVGGDKGLCYVGTKEKVSCAIRKGTLANVGIAYAVDREVAAPIRRGSEAGLLHVYAEGAYVYSAPLYYMEDIEKL